MPGDLKIVLTIVGGIIAIILLVWWLSTEPATDDSEGTYYGSLDRAPETPENEARRRQH